MPKKVRELMNTAPITLERTAPVVDAARKMLEANVGAVIVTDVGHVVGVVTDRDIAVRAVARHRDPAKTPLGDICSASLTTLMPDDDIEQAIEVMRDKAIRRIPVVDGNHRPLGIISLGDLALEREPKSVLAQISAAQATP